MFELLKEMWAIYPVKTFCWHVVWIFLGFCAGSYAVYSALGQVG